MGARRSKHSRSVKEERARFGLSRQIKYRPVLPIIAVVCDDTKTAIAYFELLKQEVKSSVTVKIVRAPRSGATAQEIADCAKRISPSRSERDSDPNDLVWAIIDLEAEPHLRNAAYVAKKSAQRANVHVALSDPCYEVWTLAHLCDIGESLRDCSAVFDKIRYEWVAKFGQTLDRKTHMDCRQLHALRRDAITRAKAKPPGSNQSWTEVYQVVESILALVGVNEQGLA